MTGRRRTTIHDLTTLRIHPDGSRLRNSDSNSVLSLRRSRKAARDARGNWIANDAAGHDRVKKFRTRRNKHPQCEEQKDEQDSEFIEGSSRDAGNNLAEEGIDTRALRKKAFDEDYSFLQVENGAELLGGNNADPPPIALSADDAIMQYFPQPSSDLLKCIHYYASQYYSSEGLLLDLPREARREKHRRASEAPNGNRAHESEDVNNDADGPGDESENEDEEDDDNSPKDLYKAFDGSALMAIGMLLQEQVYSLISKGPPPGWVNAADQDPAVGSYVKGNRRKSNATPEDESESFGAESPDRKPVHLRGDDVHNFGDRDEVVASEEDSDYNSSSSSSS